MLHVHLSVEPQLFQSTTPFSYDFAIHDAYPFMPSRTHLEVLSTVMESQRNNAGELQLEFGEEFLKRNDTVSDADETKCLFTAIWLFETGRRDKCRPAP